MTKPKKKDSILAEPYNLIKMVVEAARLVGAGLKAVLVGARQASNDPATSTKEAKEGYAQMQAELKEEGASDAWKRFIYTGLAIQAFLIVLTLSHVVLGNYLIFAQLLCLTVACIWLFGYKPWILRNKARVTFVQYTKRLSKDPGCLLLWNSIKLLD